MSPVEVMVPLITMSALMMEGADRMRARLGAGVGAAAIIGCEAGALSLLLLENMAASLDEVVGVLHDVIIPNFVMDMRSGAASGGTHPAQACALADLSSHPHGNRRKMTIACMDSVAMVDFHHVAIAAAVAGKHYGSRCGGMHHAAPGAREINTGMESI